MKEIKDTEKPFEGILGTSSEVELLEYLMSCPDFSFNISELARISEVPSRRTCGEIVKRFLKWEILTKVGQVGNIKQYRLNTDSQLVQTMYQFNKVLISTIMEKELGIEELEVLETYTREELIGEEVVSLEILPTSPEFTALSPGLVAEKKEVFYIRKRAEREVFTEA
ncbi:MAG: hypothetical protein LN415_03305 [Candidatus Thermoplasmatota archaeon]|nr:hypothetical protein [Candidatus Thermoplasmatota archaeon]